ncbi:MAG: FecR family protein [Bacteroidales bacterium]|jgi:ferric-dicitrate binding protein FerR (iron transport regulator)|nr:FecR family protein [Bacteroidales bacterium]
MKINTDKAWDKVYTRIKEEQLLVPEHDQKIRILAFTRKWVAGIAVLCICGMVIAYFIISKEKENTWLTVQNQDILNTLVNTLEDGSIVFLKKGSTLSYPKHFTGEKRTVSFEGEAMFDIFPDQESPFLIETKPVTVEVLGTTFDIISNGEESFKLSVQNGTVKISLKNSMINAIVKAGESVQLESGQLHKTISGHEIYDLYTEKMDFKDESLSNIIKVINLICDKPVVLKNTDVAERKMTISFSNNTPSDMIELLCIAMGLKYNDDGHTIWIDAE